MAFWHYWFSGTDSDVYDFRTKDEVSCPDSEYSIKVKFTIKIRFWVHKRLRHKQKSQNVRIRLYIKFADCIIRSKSI